MYWQSEKLVKQQYLLHVSSQYGERRPTNDWDRFASLGHPSKFQWVSGLRFLTPPTLLNRRHPNCMMFGHLLGWFTIHLWGLLPPNGFLPGAKFTLRPSLAFSYICSIITWHWSTGRQPSFLAFSRGRHLYSAWWPSRWASAHILVVLLLQRSL